MKTTPFLAVASLGLLALASSASAQRRASVPLLHQALDKNADGALSASELEAASTALLTLDRDRDGIISASEMLSERQRGGDRAQRGGDRSQRGGDRAQRGGGGARDVGMSPLELGEPGIAWYGRLDLALEEAKRSQRPILFMAAASQCSGVPGVF